MLIETTEGGVWLNFNRAFSGPPVGRWYSLICPELTQIMPAVHA